MTPTPFEIVFGKTAKLEGGYSNRADDRGGETYKGISRKNFPNWEGWNIIDNCKADHEFPGVLERYAVLQDLVKKFYKVNFFDKVWGDVIYVLSSDIAIELYDTAVLMGPQFATSCLQSALNLLNRSGQLYPDMKEDGLLGPDTIKALKTYLDKDSVNILLTWMNVMQGTRIVDLTRKDPSQESNIRGWAARIALTKNYSEEVVK
jgi:lysozyme family protein